MRAVLRMMGVEFDPWQAGLAQWMLAKREDGQYAADTTVMSIARQVGKTFVVGAVAFALCIMHPRTLCIWTAHHGKTSSETFADLWTIARLPKVAKHVRSVKIGENHQSITFTNGSRILIGSRRQGFGRGFKKVGILVLDEAQELPESAMDNMVPATNQADNPLILLMGTPPGPNDNGEVFTNLRADALAAGNGEGDTLFVEISADDDADPHDRDQWAKANPSYPHRTKARAILRMLKHLGAASFRREALGIWDATNRIGPMIDPAAWSILTGPAPDGEISCIAVKFSPDGARQSVAVSVPTDKGAFVEVMPEVTGATSMGVKRTAAWIADHATGVDAIVVDGKSTAGALVEELLDLGVHHRKIVRPTTDQAITAYAGLLEAVRDATVSHAGQPGLNASIASSKRRKIGDMGGWGFDPMTTDDDSTPTEAVALARHWTGGSRKRNGRKRGSRAVFA